MRIAIVLLLGCSASSSSPEVAVDAPPAMSDARTAECAGKQAQPRDATWQIAVGTTMRTARVHVPASYDPATPSPLVLDIHGRTQSGSAQAALSRSIARSDAAGFVLVHPESATSPTSWNAGTCCDPATSQNLDDAAYFAALLDELEAELCIDRTRVFAMGMSNGGYMAHALACKLADRIAAIGPVAGLLLQSPCTPARPVPVMMINGTDDTLSRYQYVAHGVDFWIANNGCTTTATTYQNGDTTCVTHGGCTADADVVLCTVDGGGHQWPGGDALPLLGKKSDDIIATDALWSFFAAHPSR